MGRTVSTFSVGSVAIPAHNKAAIIRRCVDALLIGLASEIEVLVSCNQRIDGTLDIVRSSWKEMQVIGVEKASNRAALQAANETLSVFPRTTWTRTWSYQ
jgi:hypothetical protein